MSVATTTEHITRFFQAFNVKTESPALQYVYFDEATGLFLKNQPEINGEPAAVYVEYRNSDFDCETILILTDCDESNLITELSQRFAELNYDILALGEHIQTKYADRNEL